MHRIAPCNMRPRHVAPSLELVAHASRRMNAVARVLAKIANGRGVGESRVCEMPRRVTYVKRTQCTTRAR